jgi:hypothetical protein
VKKRTAIKQFNDWSTEWKGERKKSGAVRILKLWQRQMPRGWEREIWAGRIGFRKRSDNKGEQCTEKELFNYGPGIFELIVSGKEGNPEYRVEAIYHNMPLANQRKGQVIADAFGVLKIGKSVRPLLIEVKVAANNPWFALVENLQQIRLARACAQRIREFVHKNSKHRVERGVWGLILAPENYYKRHSGNLTDCKSLLDVLKRHSRARVAFGISDSLADGQIRIVAHNWLATRAASLDWCQERQRAC